MNEIDLINSFKSFVKGNNVGVTTNNYPTTYIVGCPRSGTTALLQLLAETGGFAYPTNCLTRFAQSMELATVIQELIFNNKFGLVGNNTEIDFSSDYGRSNGALNTNEFFHFYRRFFPNNDIRFLENNELKRVDCNELQQQVNVLQCFYNKPFASKGLMMQYNLDYFYSRLEKPVFIYIKRSPIFVMQSIYKARIKEKKSVNEWWSAKPKEFERLKEMDEFYQIAGQVYYTNKSIERALSNIPNKSKLEICYEDLVKKPVEVLNKIRDKYLQNGAELHFNDLQQISQKLKNGNVDSLDEEIIAKLKLAYEKLSIVHE